MCLAPRQLILGLMLAVMPTALPAVAEASSPVPHRVPGAHHFVAADGAWHAVYEKQPGTMRVLDTKYGTSMDRPVDSGCGRPAGASAGRAVLVCDAATGNPYPVMLDLRTGMTKHPGGFHSSDIWDTVGRYWIEGHFFPHDGAPASVFLNWRTGERVEGDIRVRRDLDTPNLTVLAPCGRSQTTGFDYAPPFVLRFPGGRLVLSRCDSSKRVVVSNCPNACTFPQLSRVWLTWTSGRWAYAYSTRTGRRSRWRFPAHDPSTGYTLEAEHTRNELFVNAVRKGATAGSYVPIPYQVALK